MIATRRILLQSFARNPLTLALHVSTCCADRFHISSKPRLLCRTHEVLPCLLRDCRSCLDGIRPPMSTTFRSMPPLAAMSSGRRERASSTTDQTSTSGPIFTSQFLLRGNDGAEPSGKLDTVVIVLNWVLPQCTTRLMSSGDPLIMQHVRQQLWARTSACGPRLLRRSGRAGRSARHACSGPHEPK